MKELLSDLLALQAVEVEIFKAQKGIAEIPQQIEELDSIIAARKSSLDGIDEDIASLEERKSAMDSELEENQILIKAADARIKKIKTNKEFLALQREIDVSKKRKSELEEKILYAMEKLERLKAERDEIAKNFESDREALEAKKEILTSQEAQLHQQIEDCQSKTETLRGSVDPSLLSKYERIKQNKKGQVVVECVDGVCNGCHMRVPAQLFNDLVRGDQLILCPICQRILYVDQD